MYMSILLWRQLVASYLVEDLVLRVLYQKASARGLPPQCFHSSATPGAPLFPLIPLTSLRNPRPGSTSLRVVSGTWPLTSFTPLIAHLTSHHSSHSYTKYKHYSFPSPTGPVLFCSCVFSFRTGYEPGVLIQRASYCHVKVAIRVG